MQCGARRVNPKWLFAAPPFVWCAVGLTALFAPGELKRLFPVFWLVHDLSLIVAFAGVLTLIFRGPGPEGPTVDEWSSWGARVDEDSPLEDLLAEVARRARLESGAA